MERRAEREFEADLIQFVEMGGFLKKARMEVIEPSMEVPFFVYISFKN